ncbi:MULTISPECIES: hypothetical protein [unclassified Actinobaculum]|uniref:hypothetical protein n=1 Tax=unclassified Actinobaculum TaxID=2609299 RepID=UPI000D528B7B|nr:MULTISPECIES: hypothetical protein [unclassified Actinobaculum]AWE42890.1 hypothetical protein DDD63_09225 [Actinobaculum sp. 313]RTE49024.1 hypothetical protein EKN07_07805 [Actinobaculum sp. 352]
MNEVDDDAGHTRASSATSDELPGQMGRRVRREPGRRRTARETLRAVALWNVISLGSLALISAAAVFVAGNRDAALGILAGALIVIGSTVASSLTLFGGALQTLLYVVKMLVIVAVLSLIVQFLAVDTRALLLSVVCATVVSLGVDMAVILHGGGPQD